jgi:hypothetical protein
VLWRYAFDECKHTVDIRQGGTAIVEVAEEENVAGEEDVRPFVVEFFVGQEEGKEWLFSSGWRLSSWRANFERRAADENEFVYHVTKFRREFGEGKVWLGLW